MNTIIFKSITHSILCMLWVWVAAFSHPIMEVTIVDWIWLISVALIGLVGGLWCLFNLNNATDRCWGYGIFGLVLLSSLVVKADVHTTIYISISTILFIISCGFNRISASYLYGLATILLLWPFFNFHLWYHILGLILLVVILVVLNIFTAVYHSELKSENDTDKKKASIVIFVLTLISTSACLVFVNQHQPIHEIAQSLWELPICYFIICVIVGVTNNTGAITLGAIGGGCYFSFLSSWLFLHNGIISVLSDMWHRVWSSLVWIWDGIIWIVVQLWGGLIWLFKNLWDVIVWIGCGIWWLLCWKWFWIGILALTIVVLLFMVLNKKSITTILTRTKVVYIKEELPIKYNGRFMTCPKCRKTMAEGKPIDKKTRFVAKTVAKNGVKGVILVGTSGAGIIGAASAKGAAIGSVVPGMGTLIGLGIGLGVGIATTAFMNKKINMATDKLVDKAYYDLGSGVLLHFKCPYPGCNNEWERYEKYGEIVKT